MAFSTDLVPTSHVLFDVDRSERLRNGREREQKEVERHMCMCIVAGKEQGNLVTAALWPKPWKVLCDGLS